MIPCRECNKPAKWVLTNMRVSRHPFICGIHKNSAPYNTMNKMGLAQKLN